MIEAAQAIDITPIIDVVITILFAIFTRYLVPLIKQRYTEYQFKELMKWCDVFVEAADQLWEKNQGGEKKQYVLEELEKLGYKIDMSHVDSMIEASVLRLHNNLNEK